MSFINTLIERAKAPDVIHDQIKPTSTKGNQNVTITVKKSGDWVSLIIWGVVVFVALCGYALFCGV